MARGVQIEKTVMEKSVTVTVIIMKVGGRRMFKKEKGGMFGKTGMSILVNGRTVLLTEEERLFG